VTRTEESQPSALFVKVPLALMDMVAEGALSRDAAWLLLVLARHINRKSGNTNVWPSRGTLAKAMNLRQARGVDTYLTELETQKCIVITERWDGDKQLPNMYTVMMPGSALRRTALRAAETPVLPAEGVVRSNAGGSAPERTGVVRHSAHELEELELEGREPEEQTPLPPDAESGSAPIDSGSDLGEVLSAADRRSQAAGIVAASTSGLTRTEQGALIRLVISALKRGWSPADVTEVLAADTTGLKNLGRGLNKRVKDMGDPPPPVAASALLPCAVAGHVDFIDDEWRQYPALNCKPCRTDAKVRHDPFGGHHEHRHPAWVETYGWDPPALDNEEMPLDPAEREAIQAAIAELADRLGPPDYDESVETAAPDTEPVGAGEVSRW